MAAKIKSMSEDIKTTSLAWQQIAYAWKNYFTIPSRVSPDEVKKYREWLLKINPDKKPLKALVLGATPELRDAFSDLGFKLYSIDINLDMFLAMDEMLLNKNAQEVLIKSNWLNNPLADSFFDVIAGDAVLPNIPCSERDNFLKEITRLLKSNGNFLTRAFYVPDQKSFSCIEDIFEHFSKKDQPVMRSAIEMVLEIQILTYDPKDHLGSMNKVKSAMEDYHQRKGMAFSNKKLQEIHDMVWDVWCQKFAGKDWVYAYRKEEEAEYKKYFEVIDVYEALDHDYSKITPMYFFAKR